MKFLISVLFVFFKISFISAQTLGVEIINETAPTVYSEKFPQIQFWMSIDFWDILRVTNLKNLDSAQYLSNFAARPTVLFCLGLPYAFIEPGTTSLDVTSPAGVLLTPQLYGFWLGNPKVNYIVVDWYTYNQGDFFGIAKNMNEIANEIGDQLAAMAFRGTNALDLTTWQLIGHSMGAHMAGLIGRRITEKFKGQFVMPRLTALDPVGPFLNYPITSCFLPHMEKTDAKFVDVIHTDTIALGSSWKLGHMDFYPNYGKNQPGCSPSCFLDFLLNAQNTCSTARAYALYAISVLYKQFFNQKLFLAVRCERNSGGLMCTNETNYMGYNIDISAKKGDYYLLTSAAIPFDLGANGTSVFIPNTEISGV